MNRDSQLLERTAAPPPPSDRLLSAVGAMKPVRTRSPGRAMLLVAIVSAAVAGVAVAWGQLRADLPFLPPGWLIAVAVVWFGAFATLLRLLLAAPRRHVAPDGFHALRMAAALLGVVIAVAFFTVDAPGHTLYTHGDEQAVSAALHCGARAGALALAPMLLSMIALRQAIPVGSWRAGAAIGAMGGALGGLVLHFICPYGGLHVLVAHAGGALGCALIGALVFPAFNRA